MAFNASLPTLLGLNGPPLTPLAFDGFCQPSLGSTDLGSPSLRSTDHSSPFLRSTDIRSPSLTSATLKPLPHTEQLRLAALFTTATHSGSVMFTTLSTPIPDCRTPHSSIASDGRRCKDQTKKNSSPFRGDIDIVKPVVGENRGTVRT